MSGKVRNLRPLIWTASLAALALLSACGGGGGVSSTPAPVPTPTPTPVPTPTPTPTPVPTPTPTPTNFITSEYNRSDGPGFHNAVTAWQAGANGAGVTLAIVDTGIDTTSPEFTGRISSASADVAGNRPIQDEDDHGNMVALVAAAARNNTGIMGIAWNATIQVLRADTPGTCAGTGTGTSGTTCSFSDDTIARGVDRAVSAGARVVNISLGGSNITAPLRTSISRAAGAGVVVVVSAGNDGGSTDPAKDPANPDPFASSIRQAGNGNVLIVGSVNDSGTISTFSNRAGTEANWTLMALGEQVCCVYENGVLKTTTNAQGTFVTVVSGTSFSAPQVSGAVALLAQAFPNLTGAQIVDLLLRTARDAGATGTDPIYGRGIMDIAAAFAPQGATALAGTQLAVSLVAGSGSTSAAMGDAITTTTSLNTIVLDSYQRAYSANLARTLRTASVEPRLLDALSMQSRPVVLGDGDAALAFTVDNRRFGAAPLRLDLADAQQARVLAASMTARLSPRQSIAIGWRQGGEGLVARIQGRRQPAFLLAQDADSALGFRHRTDAAMAYRQQFGRFALTVHGESGTGITDPLNGTKGGLNDTRRDRIARFGLSVDRRFGNLATVLGADWLREDRTMLGAHLTESLGLGGASTLFANAALSWAPSPRWTIGASGRMGWTRPDGGSAILARGRLLTSAWSFDVERARVFSDRDALALRLSQPLRVESGGLDLLLPVDYSYATQTARFGVVPLSLAPHGREVITELSWRTALASGSFATSLFTRRNPGHIAALATDRGIAVRWFAGF